MGRKVQLRGGTTLEHSSFIGAVREITVDTTKNTVVVHDGQTYGGLPLAKESVTTDHETRITRIEGDSSVEGSISYKINSAVNALKDGVSIDLDTLKELSDALNSVETDAATSLANSIASLRNELRNGASINIDTFKEVEDLLTQVNADLDDRFTKAEAKAYLQNVEGHILPTGNSTQDIGSPTNRFRAIYVDEAMLSTNTLYIGDTPVLGTDADTVVVKADPDQSILVKTTGTGTTGLQSENEVQVSTSGTNADVKVQATGTNSKVRFAGTGGIELSSPTTVQDTLTVTGDVNITGNVTVSGQSFIVDATTVKTQDNIIVINDGEVGTGVTAGRAGIQIDRGDASAFQLLFDEASDKFIVGSVGGTYETIATREFVTSEISNEEDARLLADSTLQTNINSEATTRATEDTSIRNSITALKDGSTNTIADLDAAIAVNGTAITNESTTRANADAALQTAINTEASTRSNAISNEATARANAITTEATARSNADNAITNTIAALKDGSTSTIADLDAAIATNGNAITAEASARATADTALQTAISNEATTRANADTALQTAIDTEASRIDAILSGSNVNLDTFSEVVDLINSIDTANDSALGAEITARINADTLESTTRANADAALQTAISNEATTRANAISSEATARANADAAEASIRVNQVNALQAGIDAERARIDAILASSTADKDSFAEIVSLINSVDTTNDTAFASYVTSNNARVTTVENGLANEITNRTNAVSSLNNTLTNAINAETEARQTDTATKVAKTSIQALHATDALRISGKTLSLYKADGTFESVTTQDTVYTHPASHAASMITTVDEFAHSNSKNVQDVLDDIDQALTNEINGRVNAVNSLNTSLTNYINNEIAHIDCGSIV